MVTAPFQAPVICYHRCDKKTPVLLGLLLQLVETEIIHCINKCIICCKVIKAKNKGDVEQGRGMRWKAGVVLNGQSKCH